LAEALLKNYTNLIENVVLIPSSGGVFEIVINDNLVFSKKSLGRYPDTIEIFEHLENAFE